MADDSHVNEHNKHMVNYQFIRTRIEYNLDIQSGPRIDLVKKGFSFSPKLFVLSFSTKKNT